MLANGAGRAGQGTRGSLILAGGARTAICPTRGGLELAGQTMVAPSLASVSLIFAGGAVDAAACTDISTILPRRTIATSMPASFGVLSNRTRGAARRATLPVRPSQTPGATRGATRRGDLSPCAISASRRAVCSRKPPRRTGLARCRSRGAPGVLVLSLGARGANVVAVPKLVCTCE